MYAIVDIAGQQFKVEKNKKMFVHRLENKEGSHVSFNKVLLLETNGTIMVGEPVVDGASVVAKIVSHCKGDKVLVFKKKRRKTYQKMNGHRQFFTELMIEDILEKGQKPKIAAEKPVEKKEENVATEEIKETKEAIKKTVEKSETKKTAVKTEGKKGTEKTAAKKTTAKKTEKKSE